MPTYEYACQRCGHSFDHFQPMRDEPLKVCPKCRKSALKKLVGAGAGLIFKGSGFYITDYKKKGGEKKEGGGETKEGGGSKGAESKGGEKKSSSDSKPASDSKPGGSKAPPSPSKS
jgi:putative FmdB family regulatory protein